MSVRRRSSPMREPKEPLATAIRLASAKSVVKRNPSDDALSHGDDALVELLDTFSKRLAWLAKPWGSESALSLACGLSRATISSSIRNGSASAETLRALHELTHVDLNWLVVGTGAPG